MYFSKYQKQFTLSFTRFTHFTLKIYAEFFYAFHPLLFYVLCFTAGDVSLNDSDLTI